MKSVFLAVHLLSTGEVALVNKNNALMIYGSDKCGTSMNTKCTIIQKNNGVDVQVIESIDTIKQEIEE